MFCKINNKYYVKVSNFFQEVEVIDNNIKPKLGEKNRIYSPLPNIKIVSSDEILKSIKKKNKKSEKK